jgi:hypothetical protein
MRPLLEIRRILLRALAQSGMQCQTAVRYVRRSVTNSTVNVAQCYWLSEQRTMEQLQSRLSRSETLRR